MTEASAPIRPVRVRTRSHLPLRQVRTRTRPAPQRQATVQPAATPAERAQPTVERPEETNDPLLRAVRHLNREHALILIGAKSRVLWETDTDPAGFRLLETRAFHEKHAASLIDPDDPKSPAATKAWIKHADRRTYDGITFAPGQAQRDRHLFNTWRGFAVEPDPNGNCGLFLEHLRVNVAHNDEQHYRWVLGWFAQMIQHPDIKLGTSLALRGKQGTGKTIIGDVIRRLFPNHYILLDQAGQLTGRFSGHLDSRLLIHADEAFFAGSKAELGRLKSLVTSDQWPVERKNQDIITVPNYARLFITSNERWIVPAALEERRFAVLDMGERNIQDRSFFSCMERQLQDEGGLGRLFHELREFDLSTVDVAVIPQTAALIDQKVLSLSPIDSFLYERLCAGQILPDRAGWAVPAVKEEVHDALVEHVRKQRLRASAPTIAELGTRLGQLFPGLTTLRPTLRGGRRRCWRFPSYAVCCDAFERHTTIPIPRTPGWDPDDPWADDPGPSAA